MPTSKTYPKDSYIYMEGDRAEEVFVLREGAVILTYLSPDSGREITEQIKAGEFFGIRPVMGGFLREENATAITDVTVVKFKRDEFEQFAKARPQLVVKMLRSFSDRLRKLGKMENQLLSDAGATVEQPSIRLFQVGEYYMSARKFEAARYCYEKYLDTYPNGVLVRSAKERIDYALQKVNKGLPEINFDLIEESPDARDGGEVDLDELDDLTDSRVKVPAPPELESLVVRAQDQLGNKKFNDALKTIDSVLSDPDTENLPTLHENALLLKGRIQYQGKMYADAIQTLDGFDERFPKSRDMRDFHFLLGMSYHKTEDHGQAKYYLAQVLEKNDTDHLAIQAKRAIGN